MRIQIALLQLGICGLSLGLAGVQNSTKLMAGWLVVASLWLICSILSFVTAGEESVKSNERREL